MNGQMADSKLRISKVMNRTGSDKWGPTDGTDLMQRRTHMQVRVYCSCYTQTPAPELLQESRL